MHVEHYSYWPFNLSQSINIALMYSPVEAVPKGKPGNLWWHKGEGWAYLILSICLRHPNSNLITLGSFYSELRVGEASPGDVSSLLRSELPSSHASCSSFLKNKMKSLNLGIWPSPPSPPHHPFKGLKLHYASKTWHQHLNARMQFPAWGRGWDNCCGEGDTSHGSGSSGFVQKRVQNLPQLSKHCMPAKLG